MAVVRLPGSLGFHKRFPAPNGGDPTVEILGRRQSNGRRDRRWRSWLAADIGPPYLLRICRSLPEYLAAVPETAVPQDMVLVSHRR